MRNNVLLLLVMHVVSLNAQFFESFTDGDFVANPKWLGNNSLFIVDPQNKLRLNAPAGGVAYLYTETHFPDTFTASFELIMEFSPSGSNYSRIYFMAQHQNPDNGSSYFIQAGENGSTDALRLYKSENGKATLLASGREAAISGDPSMAKVKLEYRPPGNLSIMADYDLNGSFEDQFAAMDTSLSTKEAGFFGLHCTFTASRKDKFTFDNISVSAFQADIMPPELITATVKNDNLIELCFSEALDSAFAMIPGQFLINDIYAPDLVSMDSKNEKIILTYLNGLPVMGVFTLNISGVKDLAGNTVVNQSRTLSYHRKPGQGDLMVSEILFDPYVNHEDFLEIYHCGNRTISIDSLIIKNPANGQQVVTSDKDPMVPGSYRAFTKNTAQVYSTYLPPGHAVIKPQPLPSFNNDKGTIVIMLPDGTMLDSISYTAGLHTLNEQGKNTEGVSLEKTQLKPMINEAGMWISGSKASGYATPGYTNAVFSDTQPPRLSGAEVLNAREIQLLFNDVMRAESVSTIHNYRLHPGDIMPVSAILSNDNPQKVTLRFDSDFSASENLVLNLLGLRDKNDNMLYDTSTILQYGLLPYTGSLVLSEILFNPPTGGSDFIELFNPTEYNLQLRGVIMVNEDNHDTSIIDNYYVLPPNSYIALCSDPDFLETHYRTPPESVIRTEELPALNADQGVLVFYNEAFALLDSFHYHENRHHALINDGDRKGVSLEKSVLKPVENSRFNWSSASHAVYYASPGYKNSAFFSQSVPIQGFDIEKKIFSPNRDGNDDLLFISYQLDQPGYLATFAVYSMEGYLIKNLTSNQLLGTSGLLTWDGTDNDGNAREIGVYIVVGTVWHPNGTAYQVKKDCILADFID